MNFFVFAENWTRYNFPAGFSPEQYFRKELPADDVKRINPLGKTVLSVPSRHTLEKLGKPPSQVKAMLILYRLTRS